MIQFDEDLLQPPAGYWDKRSRVSHGRSFFQVSMAGARDPSAELTTVDRATSDADATTDAFSEEMTGSEMGGGRG